MSSMGAAYVLHQKAIGLRQAVLHLLVELVGPVGKCLYWRLDPSVRHTEEINRVQPGNKIHH